MLTAHQRQRWHNTEFPDTTPLERAANDTPANDDGSLDPSRGIFFSLALVLAIIAAVLGLHSAFR
jgi:hypothetical protein